MEYNPLGIAKYTYEPHLNDMTTTITFIDGSVTSVSAPMTIANQDIGFYICVAKHFAGGDNTINDEADYWIRKRPKIAARVKAANV